MAEARKEMIIGTREAAVLSCVNVIAAVTAQREELLAYWLDLYYQVRNRHEFEHALTLDDMVVKTEGPDPVMARLDELEKKIDELKNGVTLKMDVRPVHPAPYRTAEDVIRIRSAKVAHPAYARYAWTDWSDRVNLFGENGLPLEPFRV